MTKFKNELILQTESGQSVAIDLRNALVLSSAPTLTTESRIGMQAYVVSSNKITAEYVCTAVSGSIYTWVKREISGGTGTVDIDTTLTQSGKAADAAVVGRRFTEVSEAIADYAVPDYVVTEAEDVLDRVINAQKTRTFNLAVITDLHNNGGVSDANILHACQGVGYIADRVKLDAFACLGDHTDSSGSENWTECLADILACNNHKHKQVRNTDVLELIGNHDFVSTHSPKIYKTISAYSENVVWGSMLGGYFYKDYSDYKLRIICLNTSETAWIGVSPEQYRWFIETLDLSTKEDAADWQTLILSHVPLDWSGLAVFTYVLQAYINGTSWTDGTYSCDYTGKNQATVIACVHGHIHNLLVDKLYLGDSSTSTEQIDLYRIAIPEVTESYGNHYSAPFKQDVRYAKTNDTAKDTAFNVLCIDLDTKKIEAVCYGAGIDRTINYGALGEDTVNYTNQIPLSVDVNGNEYVGYNGEDGYRVGWRVTSGGVEEQVDGMSCTGYIYIPRDGMTIRLKNVTVAGTKTPYFAEYHEGKTLKQVRSLSDVLVDDGTGVLSGTATSGTRFVRITCGVIDDTSILTLNEEIS